MKVVFKNKTLADMLTPYAGYLAESGHSTFVGGGYTTCDGKTIVIINGDEVVFTGRRTQLEDHPLGGMVKFLAKKIGLDPILYETTEPNWLWWETKMSRGAK